MTTDETRPAAPLTVTQALARVMTELPAIGKDSQITEGPQRYRYRGIEAITAHAAPLLGKYGIVLVPKVLSTEPFPYESRGGGAWVEWRMLISFTVYGPSHGLPFMDLDNMPILTAEGAPIYREDCITAGPFYTLGRDNSDKGTNKCQTAAYKYCLLQLLCIGDRADDPDNTRDETAASSPDGTAQRDGWQDMDDWLHHRDRLKLVTDQLDEAHKEALRAWMHAEGIHLPGPRAGWERVYARATEMVNPGRQVIADPTGGPITAEPAFSGDGPKRVDATAAAESLRRAQAALHGDGPLPEPTEAEATAFAGLDPAAAAEIVASVAAMSTSAVSRQLAERGITTTAGDSNARRRRLAVAIGAERAARSAG